MITVDIQGADVVRNQLLRLAERGHNLSPLLQSMGEYMTNSTLRNFENSTSPDGERWAANSPVTFGRMLGNRHHNKDGRINARGVNRVMSKRPLILSHALMGSIHYELASQSVTVGTNMVYAKTQHFGAAQGAFGRDRRGHPIPWGTIPARPFLGIGARDLPVLERMVMEYWGQMVL